MGYFAEVNIVVAGGAAKEFFEKFPHVRDDASVEEKDGFAHVSWEYDKWRDYEITDWFKARARDPECLYTEENEYNDVVTYGALFSNPFVCAKVKLEFESPIDLLGEARKFLEARLDEKDVRKAVGAFVQELGQSRAKRGAKP